MLGSAPADEAAIGSVMSSYEVALNASNTDAVMPLYAEDGVFMAPNMRRAYDAVFKAIMLKVKFTIVELVVISPQWAYVRTNSAGTQKVNATGATSAEANQELFIFKKTDDGRWQIARYSFSTTNPLQSR